MNRTKWEPYVWLLPSILLVAIFVIFPILIVFKLSFSEISKSGVVGDFIGFQNYIDAIKLPAFGIVMRNTLFWVLSVVGISTILGFIIAIYPVIIYIHHANDKYKYHEQGSEKILFFQ